MREFFREEFQTTSPEDSRRQVLKQIFILRYINNNNVDLFMYYNKNIRENFIDNKLIGNAMNINNPNIVFNPLISVIQKVVLYETKTVSFFLLFVLIYFIFSLLFVAFIFSGKQQS